MPPEIHPVIVAAPPRDIPTGVSSVEGARLTVAAIGLLGVAIWLLVHPYARITHDAALYTLFALHRLHPGALANDIFLRFGSQDRYTLFTPLYAAAVNAMGLDHAAALLTLGSQVAFLSGAWLLARRFTSPLEATVGVALLALVPGEYGGGTIFHYLEAFLTPRLPAEALALGALVAALYERYWTAIACVVVGMLLHPIMALPGAVMLIMTFVAPARWKLTLFCGALAFGAALVVVADTDLLGRLEGDWLHAVHMSSDFLFVSHWSMVDWSRSAVPLAILATGWITATVPLLRRVCGASLVMVASGLAASYVFCDLLHVSIFIDAQAWRWLWLAEVIAFALAPVILHGCWERGYTGRIAVTLLACAYAFRGLEYALYIAPASVLCAILPTSRNRDGYWRTVLLGAYLILGLAVCLDLADRLSYLPVYDATLPALPQRLDLVFGDGVVPGLLLVAAWLGLRHWGTPMAANAVLAVAAGACVALLACGWPGWTRNHYTADMYGKFAAWRGLIPAHAEVLWPDAPVSTWFFLERPSYWSTQQTAGAIFSREKALLFARRTALVSSAAEQAHIVAHDTLLGDTSGPPAFPTSIIKLNLTGMAIICSDPALQFVVSPRPLKPTPYPPVVIDPSKLQGKLYLYSCADLRS